MEVTSGSESRSSDDSSNFFIQGQPAFPSVIVIGGGIAGIAAARSLHDNAFKVVVLESRNRIGGRIHTEYSFGFPVDMGAGWLHGVCNENPLAPLIRKLGLQLYRTSGDDSVLYDHDLESCALFDMDGHPVPQGVAKEVENLFKWILKETQKIRDENAQDMSILQAVSLVLQSSPNLRPNGVAYKVLQWYFCRMEAWFATDADKISLKCWDQEHVLTGGHGLMVQGFHPIIKNLAEGVDIKLNHRVTKIARKHDRVVVTVDGCHEFSADAAIVTIPVGVLQARLVEFEPPLPEWKESAIQDMGIGNENKVALLFEKVFWPDVELLGVVADTSYDCSYFLNLHKATGHPVLVYMAAGCCAIDLEKMSDKDAADFVALQLKKMFPTTATDPIKYLVSHWWSERDSLGCYSCDLVGKPDDLSAKIQKPIGNLFFAGEATSVDHSGSVHGAFSTGILAAELCKNHVLSSTYHHYFQSSSPAVCNNRAIMEEEVVNNAPLLQISRL